MTRLGIAPNFRDLGGLATADGRVVRPGVLFRSELVVEPDDRDAQALAAHDIRLVCDLRSVSERDEAPNAWWSARGIELIGYDLLAGVPEERTPWATLAIDPDAAGAVAGMMRLYESLPDATAPFLPVLFDRIARNEGATLIHCTAGKDRTGFVSAIILLAIGVGAEAVMRDYLASRDRRTERAREATRRLILARMGTLGEAALDALMGVDAAYLRASLDAIAAAHGDVRGYLRDAGVSDEAVGRLCARLLA